VARAEFRPPTDVRGDRCDDHRGHDVLPFPRLASQAIQTAGFGKSFGAKPALAGVDLMVPRAVDWGPSRKDLSCSATSYAV
jgi:hypothetical protein